MSIKLEKKINSLKAKRKEISEQLLKLKNKTLKENKVKEDRKKMIIGEYFLNMYKKENKMNELNNILDKHLTKKRERKLFDL